ncbi:MAG: hypothetical protein KF745_00265 [Phycisphaeraceae bacterium]|nr:hypothetical protein [Phycisphaeraceae bacterium]
MIGQNLYRIKDGRFEQLGQSWLKHGFTALTGSVCCTCTGGGGSYLSPSCSDPYTAGRNATQSNLGPKWPVNANSGFYPYPFTSSSATYGYTAPPSAPATIGRRLQVATADVAPASNPGAIYYCDTHYVTQDDALAGNGLNNLSARKINNASAPGSLSFIGATIRQKAAIQVWKDNEDPSVVLQAVDYPETNYPNPTPGATLTATVTARFWVAAKVTNLGGGVTRYSYSVMNVNSDRSGGSLTVPVGCGVDVSNLYFNDVDYHSGEVWDNTDWGVTQTAGGIEWKSPKVYSADPYTNALRWSTTYTFSFDTTATATTTGTLTLGLFKPAINAGAPDSLSVPNMPIPAAGCRAEQDGVAGITPSDIAAFVNAWFTGISGGTLQGDFDCSGVVEPSDIAQYISEWFSALGGGC